MNNNPKYFGEKKRLFVEFALEDRRVLEGRQRRLKAQQARLKRLNEGQSDDGKQGQQRKEGKPGQQRKEGKPGQQLKEGKPGQKRKGVNQDAGENVPSPKKPRQQQGQKRKREKNKSSAKEDKRVPKETAPRQKKQKVEQEDRRNAANNQDQNQPRKRTSEAAGVKRPSRKERTASKKRKDVDALDAMGKLSIALFLQTILHSYATTVNQYKQRLFSSSGVAEEATKRWFE